MPHALVLNDGRHEHSAVDVQADDFGIVGHFDAQLFSGPIERVEHRPAAAEKERVGPAEAEGATERRLEAHTLLGNQVSISFDSWIMNRASSSSVLPLVTRRRSFQNSSSV